MIDVDSLEEISKRVAQKLAEKRNEDALLISRRQICELCGFRRNSSTVRKWTADPTFPKPCGKSGVARWFKSDVLEWLHSDSPQPVAE